MLLLGLRANPLKIAASAAGTLPAMAAREEVTMPVTTMEQIIRRIHQDGAVTMRGLDSLAIARAVLDYGVRAAGCKITFDPRSTPDLVDYLTVTATSGLEGAAVGAAIGAIIGLIIGQPRLASAIGVGLGLLAGSSRGLNRIEQGWRVRAVREIDGTPLVTIHKMDLT